MWGKQIKEKEPEYDVCSECKHLIEKGSGHEVIEENYTSSGWGSSDGVKIYCALHQKPYDRVRRFGYGKDEIEYSKKNEPWRRVNEDGTDYKEKK